MNTEHSAASTLQINELLVPIIALDEHKEIVWMNAAAHGCFPNVSTTRFSERIAESQAFSDAFDVAFIQQRLSSVEVVMDSVHYQLQLQPIEHAILVIFVDITNVTARSSEADKVLERTLQEIADLKKSNNDLESFAYAASHDLQEPLRMITGFLGLLQMEYEQKLDAQGQVYIQYALEGANRMKKLMDELLHYSRIGSKKENKIAINASTLVQDAMMLLQAAISESGVHIEIRALPVVYVVASQVQQVFQNLIGNAIKFRRTDVPPVIEIGYNERETEFEFYVKDNGIGIGEKFKDKVFLLFKQLNNKEKYPGSGMGLSICKKIIEYHNGKIWIQSIPNVETTVFFTLPK